MQSFFAKCAAVGIVAGGFAVTGDLGRLADRGRRLLEASTIPSEMPTQPAAAPSAPLQPSIQPGAVSPLPASEPASAAAPAAAPAPATTPVSAAAPAPAAPRESPFDAPVGRAFVVPSPPSSSPDAIDLERLAPGSRLLVWVRRPGSQAANRSTDLIALDLITPRAGEALEHRHAALTHGNETTKVHVAPRRVVIAHDAGGRIAKGGSLRLAPVRGVNGPAVEETVGTIVAIDVQSR